MQNISNWLKASRLPSQGYIFFPLILGQSMAYYFEENFSGSLFLLTHLYGLFIQLFIVYANDYADLETDRENETYTLFSGGSRVLVEGLLSKRSLKKGILVSIAGTLLVGMLLAFLYQRPLSIYLVLLSLFLLWAYSYPPIKLSYRGGGELLQALGVAILLPLFAFYVQAGNFQSFPWMILIILFPIHLGCAFSTALPDEPSDRMHKKRTFAVIKGPDVVKKTIVLLNSISFLLLLWFPIVSLHWSLKVIGAGFFLTFSMMIFYPSSKPGSKNLFYFVSLNILNVMVFVGLLSTSYFFSSL